MSESQQPLSLPDTATAYRHCRAVAKREAKNFYYAFLALPQHKSSAMCAMYAFMRRADDIADDESMPLADRRELMERWREAFHSGQSFTTEDSAVFVAVRDTQQRFHISNELLDELIAGTAMDLQEEVGPGLTRLTIGGRSFDLYETMEALDHYCYLVASVVGLVTVRIFGSTKQQTDAHAVAMGKAFQYTNILRDVREDVERGRIYLPLDLLRSHGADAEDVVQAATQGEPSAPLLTAMQALAARAETLYDVEDLLIANLDTDSRGAMRTLVGIYHALLHRIEHVHLQVFRERIRVSTAHKVGLLLRGLLLRFSA